MLCIIHAVSIKFLLTREECWGSITIYVDNQNVVKRATTAQTPYNVGDYHVPDQDLWALTTAMVDALPIDINIKWIRGHGDTNDRGEVIHGPFRRNTQLNIWTDTLATKGLNKSEHNLVFKKPLSTTKVLLKTQDGLVIQNLRKYLLRSKNGEELLNYYRDKKGWHSRTLSKIDWEATESLLRRANPIKKNRLIQVMHDWQNVGRQKGKFRDSKIKSTERQQDNITTEEKTIHLCPVGCGEVEDHLHYVKCKAEPMIAARQKSRLNVLTRLKRLRTNEFICSTISYILKSIGDCEEIQMYGERYESDDERNLLPALLGQKEIGWENMIKGFIHEGWAQAQQRHYMRLGVTSKVYSIKRWKRMFLTILSDYGHDCWTTRNEAIHGSSIKEGREVRKKRLVELTKELYKQKNDLRGSPYRRIFNMKLSKRISHGIQSLTLWVGKAEEVLKLHREEADKNTLDRWLGCR